MHDGNAVTYPLRDTVTVAILANQIIASRPLGADTLAWTLETTICREERNTSSIIHPN